MLGRRGLKTPFPGPFPFRALCEMMRGQNARPPSPYSSFFSNGDSSVWDREKICLVLFIFFQLRRSAFSLGVCVWSFLSSRTMRDGMGLWHENGYKIGPPSTLLLSSLEFLFASSAFFSACRETKRQNRICGYLCRRL